MKKRSLLIALLTLSCVISFAQTSGKKKIIISPSAKKSYTLTVLSNTKPYTVLVNGRAINGYRTILPVGSYTVTVQAKGYSEYKTKVKVNRNIVVNANLNPVRKVQNRTAHLSITIPEDIINNSINTARNQIRVFDNGRLLKGFDFELKPGDHTIRIESGGFAIEGYYTFSAGISYNIEPVMYLNIEE